MGDGPRWVFPALVWLWAQSFPLPAVPLFPLFPLSRFPHLRPEPFPAFPSGRGPCSLGVTVAGGRGRWAGPGSRGAGPAPGLSAMFVPSAAPGGGGAAREWDRRKERRQFPSRGQGSASPARPGAAAVPFPRPGAESGCVLFLSLVSAFSAPVRGPRRAPRCSLAQPPGSGRAAPDGPAVGGGPGRSPEPVRVAGNVA